MLKKQTVWLLTMIALVVVLAVYYINYDAINNMAQNEKSGEIESGNVEEEQMEGTDEQQVHVETEEFTRDDLFEAIRLQLMEERSRKKEELEAVAGSPERSAEEISAALDEMEKLNELAEKERMLEMLIISSLGYEDALVRANDKEVHITVKGQEPSRSNANEIIRMVQQELNTTNVTVSFQTDEPEK